MFRYNEHTTNRYMPELRDILLEMRNQDQYMRATIGQRYQRPEDMTPADHRWWLQVDAEHAEQLRALVEQHGWPGRSLVGDDGAEAAWLLALHADQYPAFQRRCLQLLQQAVAVGEAPSEQLAHLTDRVQVNADQPQLYGTQMHLINNQIMPWPIIDPEQLDQRRALLGLNTFEEYLADVRRSYGDIS